MVANRSARESETHNKTYHLIAKRNSRSHDTSETDHFSLPYYWILMNHPWLCSRTTVNSLQEGYLFKLTINDEAEVIIEGVWFYSALLLTF